MVIPRSFDNLAPESNIYPPQNPFRPDLFTPKLRAKPRAGWEWVSPPQESVIVIVIHIWNSLRRLHPNVTWFELFRTIEEQMPMSELERTLLELRLKGEVTEEFVQDLLQQQAIYEENKEKLEMQYKGKTIVIRGGEIFVGDNLREVLEKSSKKFPDRPYYTVSFEEAPLLFSDSSWMYS